MIYRLASGCQDYLAGCHPHAHAVLNGGGHGSPIPGALLFLVVIGAIYEIATRGRG